MSQDVRQAAAAVGAEGALERVSAGRRLTGEVTVPGEVLAAEEAILLAAITPHEGRVRNVPPGVDRLTEALGLLGVQAARVGREVRVRGVRPSGWRVLGEPVDLRALGEVGLTLLGVLAGQPSAVPVLPPPASDRRDALLAGLRAMGARIETSGAGHCVVGGGDGLVGVVHPLADPDPGVALALLVAGLGARGITALRETLGGRRRVDLLLQERGIRVERRRPPEGEGVLLCLEGGQGVRAVEAEIPGDLRLAYPLLVPPLVRKGSQVVVRRVQLRAAERGFLDLLRQIGGKLETTDLGHDLVDLTVSSSSLKPTRVAGQRAERIAAQAPLLAVLATQIPGEFVIRDVPGWQQDGVGPPDSLFALLKLMGARVGEYPEGLVIKGGQPLQGTRVESRGDPDLAMALGAAGLLAHGEMVIAGADCVGATFPDYFAVLRKLKEKR
ncbi:MAG: hypothetical protein AB1505_08245 [Candidatus Latescibacterota bacterium]